MKDTKYPIIADRASNAGIIFCIGTEESIMALGVRQQDLQRMCGIPT